MALSGLIKVFRRLLRSVCRMNRGQERSRSFSLYFRSCGRRVEIGKEVYASASEKNSLRAGRFEGVVDGSKGR